MTLPRTPDTCAHAVLKVAGLLGYARAAEVVGRKVACIRDWTNEATTSCPSWAQAVALDAAYHEAGGENAPLFDAYAAQLDIARADRDACRVALTTDLSEAASEFGEAFAAAVVLTQPGHTHNQALRAMIELDQAEGKLAGLKRRVRNFLKPGAGPGNPGGIQ